MLLVHQVALENIRKLAKHPLPVELPGAGFLDWCQEVQGSTPTDLLPLGRQILGCCCRWTKPFCISYAYLHGELTRGYNTLKVIDTSLLIYQGFPCFRFRFLYNLMTSQ